VNGVTVIEGIKADKDKGVYGFYRFDYCYDSVIEYAWRWCFGGECAETVGHR